LRVSIACVVVLYNCYKGGLALSWPPWSRIRRIVSSAASLSVRACNEDQKTEEERDGWGRGGGALYVRRQREREGDRDIETERKRENEREREMYISAGCLLCRSLSHAQE